MSTKLRTCLLATLAITNVGCPPKATTPASPSAPGIPTAPMPPAARGIYFVGLDASAAPIPHGATAANLHDLADQITALTHGKLVEVSEDGFIGAVLEMTPAAADALEKQHLPFVRYVEANQPVRADLSCTQMPCLPVGATQPQPAWPWGRVRVRYRCLRVLVDAPACEYSGQGAHVYVIDSGIDKKHVDFATTQFGNGFSLMPGTEFDDTTGHGTTMAGIIAGQRGGVAPGVTLHSCRFMGLDANGLTVGDVALARLAIRTVRMTHESRSVALMAFSTQTGSKPLNEEVDSLVAADVVAIASAGNSSWVTGPSPSPASASKCLGVGAIDWRDRVWADTVLGSHVRLFAPGARIPAPVAGGATYLAGSGTSQAAAHVAGLVARLRSIADENMDAQAVENVAMSMTTVGQLDPLQLGLAENRIAFDCPCELH